VTIFVETSALVAIMLQEEGWEQLADKIGEARKPITTAVVVFEATCALSRQRQLTPKQAHEIVLATIEAANVTVAGFTPQMTEHAVAARELFGKGRHPAALNMGDCLSYGAARYFRAPLLFKGDDFSKTDIATA